MTQRKSAVNHEDGLIEAYVLVQGQVQGVGFRAAARFFAMEIGLCGSVRNLPDGSVEILAQGQKRQIEDFLRRLTEETFGRIDHLTTSYRPLKQPFDSFLILR